MSEPPNVVIASDVLEAEISPVGAELQRLRTRGGLDLQWSGDPAIWRGRAPILFPVIGLLVGGEYRLDGKSYTMPKHGFARHGRFTVVSEEAGRCRIPADRVICHSRRLSISIPARHRLRGRRTHADAGRGDLQSR